jgi:hypothetical protein
MARVLWERFIVRFARDLRQMSCAAAAGDQTCRKFFIGLQQWVKDCDKAPASFLCLTCEQTFRTYAWPDTFMVTSLGRVREAPKRTRILC